MGALKTSANWTGNKQLLEQLKRWWDSGKLLGLYFAGDEVFPLRLKMKVPNSRQLSEEFDAVRSWIADLQQQTILRIDYKTIEHRQLGKNSVPAAAWLDNLQDAIKLLHKQREYQKFVNLVELTITQIPVWLEWIKAHPLKAMALADVWPKLMQFALWLQANPHPNIYLRQVSLPGIDSKLIEQHRAVLTTLLDLLLNEQQIDFDVKGTGNFARRYGFRSKSELIRFRILDPELALIDGQDRDITLTASDFAAIEHHSDWLAKVSSVFITENEINFLSMPQMPNSLVIFGAGYGFSGLAGNHWLKHKTVYYWGDIDTHGFAILDQLRVYLPQAQSLMMDEVTLMTHREFWGTESKPQKRQLNRLTEAEQRLYQQLCDHVYQPALRLEQERIGFEFVQARLQK